MLSCSAIPWGDKDARRADTLLAHQQFALRVDEGMGGGVEVGGLVEGGLVPAQAEVQNEGVRLQRLGWSKAGHFLQSEEGKREEGGDTLDFPLVEPGEEVEGLALGARPRRRLQLLLPMSRVQSMSDSKGRRRRRVAGTRMRSAFLTATARSHSRSPRWASASSTACCSRPTSARRPLKESPELCGANEGREWGA